MAKKKSTSKKAQKKQQQKLDTDVKVVLLMLVGIVMALLVYKKSSYMGIWLNDILGGLFGIMKYVVPIIPFIWAIYLVSKHKETILAKVVPIGIMTVCVSTIASICEIQYIIFGIYGKSVSYRNNK